MDSVKLYWYYITTDTYPIKKRMLEYNTKYERKKVYWKYSSVCNIETLAVKQ